MRVCIVQNPCRKTSSRPAFIHTVSTDTAFHPTSFAHNGGVVMTVTKNRDDHDSILSEVDTQFSETT